MLQQEIQYINLKDLVLWSENPRDPIRENANNIEIIKNALLNPKQKKWDLVGLAKSMGEYYDYSELPTVVKKNSKYIVYDGNRRVILGLLSKNFYDIDHNIRNIPSYPDEMPCNVCTEEFALLSIFRKHAGQKGTWSHLERDIFENKYLNKEKSPFLLLDEATNVISDNPILNQGFIRDEILKIEHLKQLGINIYNGKIMTSNSMDEIYEIFNILKGMIIDKTLSTRNSRKDITPLLKNDRVSEIIDKNKNNDFLDITNQNSNKNNTTNKVRTSFDEKKPKHTPKTSDKVQHELFGGKLNLKKGSVNNLYRDLKSIHNIYIKNKKEFSPNFFGFLRMGLRLLVETASNEVGFDITQYISTYFDNAKQNLTKDEKTTLSAQSIEKDKITQLLHVGAHNYKSSYNEEQTIALSLIIGKILLITHGTTPNYHNE